MQVAQELCTLKLDRMSSCCDGAAGNEAKSGGQIDSGKVKSELPLYSSFLGRIKVCKNKNKNKTKN